MDLSFLLSSKGTSSAASLALSWTFLLVQTVYPSPDKREGATWKKLVSNEVTEQGGQTLDMALLKRDLKKPVGSGFVFIGCRA